MNIIAGGKNYKWKGKNIRIVEIDGFSCATMPKKDSYVVVPKSLIGESKYKISIIAKNTYNSDKIALLIDEIKTEAQTINSGQFKEYIFYITIDNEAKHFKIVKSGNLNGNIILKQVKYEKIIEVTKEEIKAKAQEELLKDRENKLQTILEKREQHTSIIGGKEYKWTGKNVKTIKRDEFNVGEFNKNSSILIPVKIINEATYKILISASAETTGALSLNFFGNLNNNGAVSKVAITSKEIKEYGATINSPRFPDNLPMFLKVNCVGKVQIKIIKYTKISQKQRYVEKKIEKRIEKPQPKRFVSRKIKQVKDLKELSRMYFKPYEFRKDIAVKVEKVLVNSADKVPRVSIITPTRDGIELLKKCYDALILNTTYPNWEWIVGDSNSTDGTTEYIKSLNDVRVKYIQRGTTDGSFSSINNELVNFANGEYFVFLNNDTEPQPFWLHEMMAKILHNKEIGIVGAKLIYREDKIQHAGIGFIPEGPGNIGHQVLDSFPKNFANQDRFFQAVTGACLLIKAEDFRAVGGFDPIYHWCYEDVDLCLKVRKQLNKKVLYASNAILKHAESITQKKYKTGGELQKEGIRVFKERWKDKAEVDFSTFSKNENKNLYKTDITFVTCVNNMPQYINYVVNSLLKSTTKRNYELIQILNFTNQHSAAQALNLGISKAKGEIIVLCHQDVIFYEEWVDLLFERIKEIELVDKKWGVLGTAGITVKDDTFGVVHNIKGGLEWQSTKSMKFGEVQTVDEHCIIIRKSSGLKFDGVTFQGFHMYGIDLALSSINKGMRNYGILCPLVHDSKAGSLVSGKNNFMKNLNSLSKKWGDKFQIIRTPTSIIRKKIIKTFIKFKE